MKKSGITFTDIIELIQAGKEKELAEKTKIHEIILDMVIKHLLNPKEAQRYRIPAVWTGEMETEEGRAMSECDPAGRLMGVVTNVTADPHAGTISTVRVFSGSVKEGQEFYVVDQHKKERAQQIGIYAGPRRISVETIPAGNIIAISGLKGVTAGSTICDPEHISSPFESIKHIFEPVVTKSIESNNVKQLPKMIDLLKQRSMEDPTIQISVNRETGEILVSALGELHIEAKVERFLKDKKIDISVSKPIVIYKESVVKRSREFEGKSPNKHNKFYFVVENLDEKVHEFLKEGEIKEGKVRPQDRKDVAKSLTEHGLDKDQAKKVVNVYKGNLLIDMTRGIVALPEVIELIAQAFLSICDSGPLANEPCMGVKCMLMDAKLHEDAIHRGPAQVLPAVRGSLQNCIIDAGACLYEPKQILRIDCPAEYMGNVIKEIQNRRGQVIDISEESGMSVLRIKLPVAEMFGFESVLKSATGGHGFQSLIDIVYEKLVQNLQEKIVLSIRKRKGLKEEIPRVELS